jgi:endonuclease/exonuclease/phosphatase family metal-dependent hydrolase
VARGSRLAEIIDFLRSTNAELICLQETDRNARRTGSRNIAAEIAQALRMNYVFGVEFEELSQGTREAPAYHGQATFSSYPLIDSRILRFRKQSMFWHPRWWIPKHPKLQRRIGGRMALFTRVVLGERGLAVYNLHLESRSDPTRREQLAEILEEARRYDTDSAVIAAGDFNLDVNGSAMSSVIDDMRIHNPFKSLHERTTPSKHFGREAAIDGILIKGTLNTVSAHVHTDVSASDHFPLSLTLTVADQAALPI